eukprot:XP_011618637.1 PREDICTED: uncharacterized protein LOC105419029 [Takifugu rubripes]
MVAETLICNKCRSSHVSWSQTVLTQLDLAHRYACDIRVIRLLRERGLGNSPTRVLKQLRENHTEEWLNRVLRRLVWILLCSYVDCGCCVELGETKLRARFSGWPDLAIKLDIWHFMPRLAVGCTTNAHRPYPLFMSRLSACIFEWDAADLARLCEAKEQQFRAQGLSLPTGDIHKHPSREELTLHCQRRTRGEETTVQLVEELLHTLMGSRQTGQALQDMHPDSEETAQLIEEHDVVKDDLSDLPEDPTVVLEPSLAPTATVTTSVVSSPAPWTPTIIITAPKPSTPVAPSAPTPRSSMAANPSALHTSTPATTSVAADEDVVVDDKNRPGYQHVDSLGEYLVELQEQTVLFLNPQQTDTIISLWQNLQDYDKQQTPTMTTNIYQAGQVPSIRSPQRGGEGNGRTAGATEKVIRTFRGILNKLTPEMFESLMKQVDELNIDTEETLNAVVELIVNKALSEQSYSATYAKMCHHLKGLMVSSQSSNDFVLLHKRLLTRCQMEFQNCGLLTQKEKDVSVQEVSTSTPTAEPNMPVQLLD